MHRASAIAARTIYRARQTLPKNEWSVLNKSNICTCSQTSALQCLDKANFELAWQSSAYGVSQQSFSPNQRSKFWTWQYTTSSKGEDKDKGKGEEEEAPDRTQADEASESAQGGPEETVSDADGTVEDLELAQKCESLEGTIKAKEAEIVDLKEKMLRVLADMENLRERTSRQIENSNKFAIQGFVKGLLDVSDNLERALTAVDDKYLEEPSEDGDTKPFKLLKSLHEGVKMTENQLLQVFNKNGVERYFPVDEKFDPNLHEARFEIAMEGKEPGTVAVVTKAGFALHGRIVRPAEVGVVPDK